MDNWAVNRSQPGNFIIEDADGQYVAEVSEEKCNEAHLRLIQAAPHLLSIVKALVESSPEDQPFARSIIHNYRL